MNKCAKCCLCFAIVVASLIILIISVVVGVLVNRKQDYVKFTNFKAEIKQGQFSKYHDILIVQPKKQYTIDRVYPRVNDTIPFMDTGDEEKENEKMFDDEVTLGPFIIKRSFWKTEKEPCPKICEPYAFGFKRNLTLCDKYVRYHTFALLGSDYQCVWVESGTKFPVAVESYEYYDGSYFLKSSFEFCSFALNEEPKKAKSTSQTVKSVSADRFSKRILLTEEKKEKGIIGFKNYMTKLFGKITNNSF